jgi:hypothetical protein
MSHCPRDKPRLPLNCTDPKLAGWGMPCVPHVSPPAPCVPGPSGSHTVLVPCNICRSKRVRMVCDTMSRCSLSGKLLLCARSRPLCAEEACLVGTAHPECFLCVCDSCLAHDRERRQPHIATCDCGAHFVRRAHILSSRAVAAYVPDGRHSMCGECSPSSRDTVTCHACKMAVNPEDATVCTDTDRYSTALFVCIPCVVQAHGSGCGYGAPLLEKESTPKWFF